VEAAHPIWRPLGQLLVDKDLLTQEELEAVLAEQSRSGRRLGEIIVERRLVSGPALTSALAEQWGIVLTTESGFGTGLRAEIEARHRAARMREVGAEADAEITLDLVAEVIDVLAEAHDEDLRPTPCAAPVDPPGDAQIHHLPTPAELHLLFIPTPEGYRLAEAAGPAPAPGTAMAAGVVSRIGASPLPGDRRPCAFLLPE
jgi:hypothetical protein